MPLDLTGMDFLAETFRGMRMLVPCFILTVAALVVIAYDLFLTRARSQRCATVALVGLGLAAFDTIRLWAATETVGNVNRLILGWGILAVDRFTLFFALLFIAATIVVVVMSRNSSELRDTRLGEYYALLLIATLAGILLAGSTNLLMIYLAFETLSLPSYVLAGYRKGIRQAAEASLKYMLFGAVASGVMLYGISILYGLTGSLDIRAIAAIPPASYPAYMLTMALIIAGFGFKMSVVPFHFWAPDVYEGAPTPITAYLSVVSKAAGFAVFMRLLAPYFDVSTIAPYAAGAIGVFSKRFDLLSVFWILSVLTMTIGNFVALRQTDIKRLLAYSSIAHAGYMLTAFVAHSPNGFHAVLFYLVVYSLANLGMFVAVMVMHAQTGSFEIAGYRGLVHRSPALAVAIGVLLWSLVGLPPSAGFVGKWKLFLSVIEAGGDSPMWAFYYSLVLIALLNSVVSLFYYVAIIRVMCFYKPEESDRPFRVSRAAKAAALAFAIPVLALQLDWQPVSRFAFGGMHIRWEQIAVGAPPSTSTGGIPETGEGQR